MAGEAQAVASLAVAGVEIGRVALVGQPRRCRGMGLVAETALPLRERRVQLGFLVLQQALGRRQHAALVVLYLRSVAAETQLGRFVGEQPFIFRRMRMVAA